MKFTIYCFAVYGALTFLVETAHSVLDGWEFYHELRLRRAKRKLREVIDKTKGRAA